MGAIVGKRATPETGHNVEALPKIRNRFRFLYMAHPHRWVFDAEDIKEGGDGWLPDLGQLNLSPGVGGVKEGGVIDLAIVSAQRSGWTVISDNDPRLGEYRNYLQKFPTQGKTEVWASVFESVRLIGNRPSWKPDVVAFRQFRRHLVASGIVPPMDPAVREAKIDDVRGEVDRMQGRLAAGAHNPALADRVRRRQALLDGMQSAEVAEPEVPPTPRPRTRAPKAPPVAVP